MVRILLIALLSLAACDSTDVPVQGLSAEAAASLEPLLLDEHHAEALYARVIADFGPVQPFVNIREAEIRHAASLEAVYARYGLRLPDNPFTPETVDGFLSVAAACAAAVDAEIANAALYDAALRVDLPADIRQVVTSNRSASLDSHLPAFERCAASSSRRSH
ncbi:MAG: hypothetical protein SangKO_098690 [Sandaracinaceae bacterium]